MFSDEILEEILSDRKIMKIPCEYKSDMLHTVEKVLENRKMLKEEAKNATLYESKLF
ncbi:MAG: hypothetical protein LUI12_02040 [Clostridiales bacterium]|nr:hypothetical protein [Clostridiales bacterium]